MSVFKDIVKSLSQAISIEQGSRVIELHTKQELYDYLDNFCFESVRDTNLSSVYFLIEFDNHVEPIYFRRFEDCWFASPCGLFEFPLNDDNVMEFVKAMYDEDSLEEAYEFEKTMQRNGHHYEIDCPQCFPFLPDSIKILDVLSDSECLDWLLEKRNIYTKLRF